MPGRIRRSTFTAVSAVLALCTAAVVTGCGAADTGTPKAAASSAGTHAATASSGATPPTGSGVETPATAPATAPEPSPTPTTPIVEASPTDRPEPAPATGSAPPAATPPAVAKPVAPTPTKGNPGAALTPAVQPAGLAQLPMAPKLGWKPDGPLSSQDVQGRKITLNECASVTGATAWQQQGYLSAARNPAGQQLFSFSAPEAAHAAYQQLLADMDACQTASRQLQARQGVAQDATVTRTAATADGRSWSRTWTGVGGMSAPERQTNHLYALQQGAVLTLFQFDELQERPAPAHDTGTDPSVLAALAALGAQH